MKLISIKADFLVIVAGPSARKKQEFFYCHSHRTIGYLREGLPNANFFCGEFTRNVTHLCCNKLSFHFQDRKNGDTSSKADEFAKEVFC